MKKRTLFTTVSVLALFGVAPLTKQTVHAATPATTRAVAAGDASVLYPSSFNVNIEGVSHNSDVMKVTADKTYQGTCTVGYYGADGRLPLAHMTLISDNPNVKMTVVSVTAEDPMAPSGRFTIHFNISVHGETSTAPVVSYIHIERTDGGKMTSYGHGQTFVIVAPVSYTHLTLPTNREV